MIYNYAAVLDIPDAPDYIIGVIPVGEENPYIDTYTVDIPQYYIVYAGYTWDYDAETETGVFTSPYGEIVGVTATNTCAVCLKSTGEVINVVIANAGDPWPDPDTQLVTITFNTYVNVGFYWDGTNFIGPDGVTV